MQKQLEIVTGLTTEDTETIALVKLLQLSERSLQYAELTLEQAFDLPSDR